MSNDRVAQLSDALFAALNQGERAMVQIGWTHQNYPWRDQLEELSSLARGQLPLPVEPIPADYADSAE